jgi:hypothetical protein
MCVPVRGLNSLIGFELLRRGGTRIYTDTHDALYTQPIQ